MKPITRLEKLLATAAGEYEGTLPPPETREEIYLLNIIEKINSRGMTPQEIDTAIAEYLNTHDADIVTETELKQELGNYVHKDGNKVLADINYSAAEQAKVTAAYDARHTHDNKAVIDGITAASVQAWNAAQANVNADWNANSGDAQILNKPNLSGFITRLTSDLEYYYTKTQTYTQAEVNALVSAIPKFKIEVVQTLPTSNISAATVYLLPDTNADSLNLYTEYIYVNNGWEMLGTQTVDLSGYVTTADLNTALTSAMAAKADASHTHAPSDITGLAEALAGKQAALTFDGTPTEGSNNPVTSGGVYEAIAESQGMITFDGTPTEGSDNPVTSNGVYEAIKDMCCCKMVYCTNDGRYHKFNYKIIQSTRALMLVLAGNQNGAPKIISVSTDGYISDSGSSVAGGADGYSQATIDSGSGAWAPLFIFYNPKYVEIVAPW